MSFHSGGYVQKLLQNDAGKMTDNSPDDNLPTYSVERRDAIKEARLEKSKKSLRSGSCRVKR
jgi:hypothetical protein